MAPATLTLSRVEQAAVLRHLEVQYCRLPDTSTDRPIIEAVLHHCRSSTTFALTELETVVFLRHIRIQRNVMARDLMALEERRIRGGFNGTLDAAHRALDTDGMMLDDVIRRLWDMLVN